MHASKPFPTVLLSRTSRRVPLAALLTSSLASLGSAQLSTTQDDGWRWEITPYVWATDVGIDTRLGGRQVVDTSIPVEDLIEDIDLTFQGRVEVGRGAHGLLLDVFYVSMSDEVNGFPLPQGAGTGDLDWKLDMTVADLAGTWDPEGDQRGFSFLYGVRILDQRADVDASFTTMSGTSQQSYEASETLVDALLGVRFRAELVNGLEFCTQIDASTGGTKHTWSAFPSLAWTPGNGWLSVLAGYRTMAIDFEESGELDTELTLSGPLVGLRASL